MSNPKHVLIVGGTAGVGLAVARRLAAQGDRVTLTGRDATRARAAADGLGAGHQGLALDLADTGQVAAALADLGPVDHLVLCAVERDQNTIRHYDADAARRAFDIKVVGYNAVVAALQDRLNSDASIVLLGGVAFLRPYPGSTSVSAMNGAVVGMMRTYVAELAPVRINVIHPGLVVGTETHAAGPPALIAGLLARTPSGRFATVDDIAQAAQFLLDCPGINGAELVIDGGFHLR